MKKALQIAWYEAQMSCRGWRFWLLLGLSAGISLFARNDYIARADYGYFLQPSFSFMHPSFGLMLSVVVLGSVALALDVCGRLRRTGMDQIVFPLPVETMEIMWGRLLGVLIVIAPVSALGVFSLGLWQALYGHASVVWQPFIAAYAILVIPFLVPVTALLITLRSFWKHDFAALLGAAIVGSALAWFGYRYGLIVDVVDVLDRLGASSPTLGARINWWRYAPAAIAQVAAGVVILYLAPLYLRRQQPQRYVKVRGKSYGLFKTPTLIRWVTNLRFDRGLRLGYRLTLAMLILVYSAGLLWASYRMHERRLIHQPIDAVQAAQWMDTASRPALDLQHVNIQVKPDGDYRSVTFETALDFVTTGEVNRIDLELDSRYEVIGARIDDKPVYHEQWSEGVMFDLTAAPLQPNSTHTLLLKYAGRPPALHPEYSALENGWLPLPWSRMRTENRRWASMEDDLFDADVTLTMKPAQRGAFAGALQEESEDGGVRVEHWRSFHPVSKLEIYWGRYGHVDSEKSGARIRFFYLPTHQYQAQVYLEDITDQEEYVSEKLGALPFPQLTIVEKPYEPDTRFSESGFFQWSKKSRSVNRVNQNGMPGQIEVLENHICYLHEGIWSLERYDLNPREVKFFRLLRPTVEQVRNQFYNRLIETYYEESLNPVGELAFWIQEDLSGYVSKLLERNPWRQRDELRFDVGHTPELPLSVAQHSNLLALHKSGQYPALERVRGEGLFRMLHHLLGDDKWWELQKEIFRQHRFQPLPVDTLLGMAEDLYGESLDWFRDQWLNGSVLPEYEITLAEARVRENKEKFTLEYETLIQVKNLGDGWMKVPIFLETEMDYVFRDLPLGPGEEKTLEIVVPNRPILAAVDPEHWVVQVPYRDPDKNRRMHSERRVFIQGDDSPVMSQGSQRGRGRGRHGWHFGGW
ncbi:MAG: hypothetical protein GC154_20270 [bacterium]|nr:hypothetical protein [bacterium]